MAKILNTSIKNRKDTTANWTSNNPVLLNGELGIEVTNNDEVKLKIGDGSSNWNSLSYVYLDNVWSGTLNEYNAGKSNGEINDDTICIITDDDFYTNIDLINQLNNKIDISDESSLNVNSANILNKPSWDANPEVFMNRGKATTVGITDYFDDIPNGVYLNGDFNNPAEHNPQNYGLVLAFGYGVSYKARLFLGFIHTTNNIVVKVATRADNGLWMSDSWKEIFNE